MIHDTGFTQFIPPTSMFGTVAAWAMAAGAVSGSYVFGCDATDEIAHCYIPVIAPSNSGVDAQGVVKKGALIKSIEIDFEILTAALDAGSAVIRKYKRGVDGSVVVVSTPTFTYDSGHDSAAERIDVDQHKMTLTLDTPFYLENDEYLWVDLVLDKAGTSTVEVLGAFVNYTFRA